MKRVAVSAIESLESRMFLSAALASVPAAGASVAPGVVMSTTAPSIFGLKLKATAGTPFSGAVGFYASPVLDPPLTYAASINWGDGATSTATITYGTNGISFGYIMHGVHTYAKAGTYTAQVTLVTTPINPNSGLPTTIVETIRDTVTVAPFPVNTSNGVTITEVAGKAFNAKLGTFSWPAPATNLSATITWGDGTTSKGVITATGVTGIDVIDFKVTGGHTYALPGKYAIHIVVSRPSPVAGGAAQLIASIESTAIVLAPPVAA